MNRATITFLATLLSSTLGMIFFVVMIVIAGIKGWGRFGDPKEWENSPEDDFLAQQELHDLKQKDPELYKDVDLEDYEIYE